MVSRTLASRILNCPRCTWPLLDSTREGPRLFLCKRCDGKWIMPRDLADAFGEKAHPQQWVEDKFATIKVRKSAISCPGKHGQMDAYTLVLAKQKLTLRYCEECRGIWIDSKESKTLASFLRMRVAILQKSKMVVAENAGYLFQLFANFPIGIYYPTRKKPLAVFFFMVLAFCAFLKTLLGFDAPFFEDSWMLVSPSYLAGEQPWAILSSTMMPENAVLICANFFFIYLFGAHIEDRCGILGFLQIFLYSALAASLLSVMVSPDNASPVAGPAGAISGLMGGYLALFPKTRVWLRIFSLQFTVSQWLLITLWCLIQFLVAWWDGPHVAWYAQLGAFATGASTAYLMRRFWIPRKRFRY